MTTHFHWIVWIDHAQAKLISFNRDVAQTLQVKPAHGSGHLHHHAGSNTDGRNAKDLGFYEAVAKALAPAGEIILCGPANAKVELKHYLDANHPQTAKKVMKIEAADHPSEGQLLALGRKEFKLIDKMLPR